MDKEYGHVKIPIELINQIDLFMDKYKHHGFTTRVEVIKTALREFFKNNGGNKNYQTKSEERGTPCGEESLPPKNIGGEDESPKGGNKCGNIMCRVQETNPSEQLETMVLHKVQEEKKAYTTKCIPTRICKGGEDEDGIRKDIG